MNLSECLLYRDISELGEIASLYNCECNRNSKLELVQSIHHYMLNKNMYHDTLKNMETALLYFSTYILFQPKRLFTINELVVKGNYVCKQLNIDASPRTWITLLLKKGWLFPTSSKYQVQLEIPADLHSFLKKRFILYWFETCEIDINQKRMMEGYIDEGETMVLDLYLFLQHLRQTVTPLTLDGAIFKKQQQLLMHKFHVKEPLINEKGWRFGYGRRFPSYPNRFALIYDFCFEKGWLSEEEGLLTVTNKGETFININNKVQIPLFQRELSQYWLKLYKSPIPALPFIFTFLTEILDERWIHLNDLYTLLSPWLEEYYFDDIHTIYRKRIIQMLVHLGLVRVSLDLKYITLKNSL